MKVIVIGAGASGVVAAITYKRNHASDDVLIIEQLEKPLKKLLATGNGKCNLGNSNINYSLFNNETFTKSTIDKYDYKKFFESISIKTKLIGDLAYPISESAVSVRDALLKEVKKLNINIYSSEKLIDYKVENKIKVITDKNTYIADKLILSGGLKSSPKLGSDGSIIDILERHHYQITPLKPGLCPIYTKEKTKEIDGVRVKAKVTLKLNGKLIHEENGEVLFKEHGLSGIVMFNASSFISRLGNENVKISLDLLPDYNESELLNYYKSEGLENTLLAFINPKISTYLKNRFKDEKSIIKSIKNLEFLFEKSYGYEFSQVTVGGIKYTEITDDFESKREKNVYLIGELLDIDGPCGGYNLTWAFASAIKMASK